MENVVCALELIIGRKENTPNSKLNHITIIFEEEKTKKGLIIKVE